MASGKVSMMAAWPAVLAAVLLAACQTPAGPADRAAVAAFPFETDHECNAVVADRLVSEGVDGASVRKLWYDVQRGREANGDNRIVGYTVWTRMADRPGFVIVDLTKQCFVRQVYTRGGLDLPGLPAF